MSGLTKRFIISEPHHPAIGDFFVAQKRRLLGLKSYIKLRKMSGRRADWQLTFKRWQANLMQPGASWRWVVQPGIALF